MMMMTMRVAGILIALLAAVSSAAAGAAGGTVTRMQLSHTDGGRGLTPGELLQRMALLSHTRAARLLSGSSSSATLSASENPGYGEYHVSLAIGTPPQPVELELDTGSDLVWTQCLPCQACYDQDLPYFNPSNSSTFVSSRCSSPACRQLPLPSCGTQNWGNQTCVYTYSYGDRSVTTGYLAADTFTFGGGASAAAADGVAFGCGIFNQGVFSFNLTGTGIAGFGRGALSLPSQLKVGNFSYCFTSDNTPSPVLLGLPANLYNGSGGAAVQTTPFNMASTAHYYLNLLSITVGSRRLPVPPSTFALNADGTGGTIIDSGTTLTLLPPQVFSLLGDALAAELRMKPVAVTSQPGFLCFPASAATKFPKLRLQFEGATLDLPQENYVFQQDDNTVCVTMQPMLPGINVTIIGNYQQQNLHVLYDLAANTLSFVPAQCDKI